MTLVRRGLERAKREILHWLGREPRIVVDIRPRVEVHGSEYGAFAVWPQGIPHRGIVYSLGVGEDISFDLSLIKSHEVTVHAFDPTPRSITWIGNRDLPPEYHFHPWAVADRDGMLELFPPRNPEHVSHTAVPTGDTSKKPLKVPVRRLTSIMGDLGHHRIDVLKMDIEGFEYPVIRDLLEAGLEVDQIAVEFHHWLDGMTVGDTMEALSRLQRSGYMVFHVSPRGHEVSLLHRRAWARHGRALR